MYLIIAVKVLYMEKDSEVGEMAEKKSMKYGNRVILHVPMDHFFPKITEYEAKNPCDFSFIN